MQDLDFIMFRVGEELLQEQLAQLFVVVPHAVDVPLEVALIDKLSQGVLLEGGDGAAEIAQAAVELLHERHRQHHIADADGGCEAFGKGIHVDYLAAHIHAEQGRDRLSYQPKFRVVVIFNNISLTGSCPAQKFIAAADRGDNPRREVVGRADVDNVAADGVQGGN